MTAEFRQNWKRLSNKNTHKYNTGDDADLVRFQDSHLLTTSATGIGPYPISPAAPNPTDVLAFDGTQYVPSGIIPGGGGGGGSTLFYATIGSGVGADYESIKAAMIAGGVSSSGQMTFDIVADTHEAEDILTDNSNQSITIRILNGALWSFGTSKINTIGAFSKTFSLSVYGYGTGRISFKLASGRLLDTSTTTHKFLMDGISINNDSTSSASIARDGDWEFRNCKIRLPGSSNGFISPPSSFTKGVIKNCSLVCQAGDADIIAATTQWLEIDGLYISGACSASARVLRLQDPDNVISNVFFDNLTGSSLILEVGGQWSNINSINTSGSSNDFVFKIKDKFSLSDSKMLSSDIQFNASNAPQITNVVISDSHLDNITLNQPPRSDIGVAHSGLGISNCKTESNLVVQASNVRVTSCDIGGFLTVQGSGTVVSSCDAQQIHVLAQAANTVIDSCKTDFAVIDMGANTLTGVQATSSGIVNPTIHFDKYTEKLNEVTHATVINIDPADGNVHKVTMTGNVALDILPMSTGHAALSITLILVHSGAARSVTWNAAIKWPSATAPTLSSSSGDIDIVTFVSDDRGTTWYGIVGGLTY